MSICNYNVVRKTYIDNIAGPTVRAALESMNPFVTSEVDLSDPDTANDLGALNMSGIGAESAHQMEDMFLECSFMSANRLEKIVEMGKYGQVIKVDYQPDTHFVLFL